MKPQCDYCNDLGVITIDGNMEFCQSEHCATIKQIQGEAKRLSDFVSDVQLFCEAPIAIKDSETILKYRNMKTSLERYLQGKT